MMTVGKGLRLGLRLKYTPQCDKVTATNEKNVSNSIVKVDNMNV